jgi:hypothetical protein
MATSIKMTVFWDVALCSLMEIDVSQMLTASSITLMMEAGQFLPDSTLQHPRRQSSSNYFVLFSQIQQL